MIRIIVYSLVTRKGTEEGLRITECEAAGGKMLNSKNEGFTPKLWTLCSGSNSVKPGVAQLSQTCLSWVPLLIFMLNVDFKNLDFRI